MAKAKKYIYDPLSIQKGDSGGNFSIRLLYLLPSSDPRATLLCRLVETNIPDYRPGRSTSVQSISRVEYQALSYTWGDPTLRQSVLVVHDDDDTTPIGAINITDNLHSALLNLRRPEKTLVLWVDAICIDQSNILERNSQVSNIPQTYSEATNVLVWLGVDSIQNDGQLCLSFFSKLASLISEDSNRENADVGSWRTRFKINQMVSLFLDSSKPRLIATFLSRPWFRRRWIVQEVVLANDVTVHCGTASVSWQHFELAFIELFENDRGGFSEEHRSTLRTISRIRHADSGAKKQVPLDTLVEFSSFICADPRDRLYALHGVIQHWLPDPRNVSTGNVDYALPIRDVFTNFAIIMMELDRQPEKTRLSKTYNPTTHLLQLAAAFKQQNSAEERRVPHKICEDIPSWVPDWTGTLSFKPLNHSPANRDASTGMKNCRYEVLPFNNGQRILASTGIIYDKVTANIVLDINTLFGPIHEAKNTLSNFLCSVADRLQETNFFRGGDINIYKPTKEHIVIALATALVANWEHTPANSYFAQDSRFPGDFLKQLGSEKHHLPEILHKWPAYVELITITMQGRGLFLTERGYVGIGAADVQAGDMVCILSGIRIPFILRPNSCGEAIPRYNRSGSSRHQLKSKNRFAEILSELEQDPSMHCKFQLMGDAYVHGLMEGEAAGEFGSQSLEDALSVLLII